MDEENLKWYEKHWIIWVLTVVITPVGLFLMWRYSRHGTALKIAATVIFGLLFLVKAYDPPAKTNRVEQKAIKIEHKVDLGLTVDEFIADYNKVAAEYYGDSLSRQDFHLVDKDNKKSLFAHMGADTAIALALNDSKEHITEITVYAKPKGKTEELSVKQAGSMYLHSIMALGFDLKEATTTLNKLSVNMKHSTVTLHGFEFIAGLFDGVLIFSIRKSK